jgi:tripartite-type tricarboxylate transporter receptor subunit TctC
MDNKQLLEKRAMSNHVMPLLKKAVLGSFAAGLIALGISVPVLAQDAPYYEGKTINVVIRSTPGGGYDFYGRLIARHLGKHIPGNPEVIPVNRPGAGGLVAANYMYEQAPNDGTEILIASRELALSERLGYDGVRYKTAELIPIGNIARTTRVIYARPETDLTSLDDLVNDDTTFKWGTTGPGSGDFQLARILTNAGLPIETVTGYAGSQGYTMGVIRGEVDGASGSYSSAKTVIEDEGLTIIAKLGNHPDLVDVQDVRDLLEGDSRVLANILATPLLAGRPFFTAPGTPDEPVQILREAFSQAANDPELISEAERAERGVGYTAPEEMADLYQEILNAPDSVISQLESE